MEVKGKTDRRNKELVHIIAIYSHYVRQMLITIDF